MTATINGAAGAIIQHSTFNIQHPSAASAARGFPSCVALRRSRHSCKFVQFVVKIILAVPSRSEPFEYFEYFVV
jgi:hypothetical protein